MELIIKNKGLKLIKKYGQYYIRFVGGQYEEYPCDLHITNKEALTIIYENVEIKTVRDAYKKQVKWTKDFFVDSGLKDYLFYKCCLNESTIKSVLKKLDRHKDIKMEFYETIMYEDFPKSRAISECNYTAQKLNSYANMTVAEAYQFLIHLRENPNSAIESLKLYFSKIHSSNGKEQNYE